MSKRTVIFALLFIVGISLLNVVVLIEASYQGDQLVVDPFEKNVLPAATNFDLVTDYLCNYRSNRCDIYNKGKSCLQFSRKCNDPK